MANFFTADLHFGHENLRARARKHFPDIHTMDESIIAGINDRCSEEDDLYILGDVSFRKPEETAGLLARIAPRLHLVAGNHDHRKIRELPVWESVQPYLKLKDNGRITVLSHFPFIVWDRSHYGSYHLHGHLHGRMPDSTQRCDVGVDPQGFRPITLDEAIERMSLAEPHIDAHG